MRADETAPPVASTVGTITDSPRRDHVHPKPGDRIGRYRVDAEIGVGAQSVVVRATDLERDRVVAIKLLHGTDTRATTRLLREARALGQVEHPNIVRVLDVGEHEGRAFVALEYIDGWNLAQWWKTEANDRARRIASLTKAGRGLAAAHAAGLVHRDFKPTNVLVGRDGRVVVTDFGLVLDTTPTPDAARLTDRGALVGTPGYMAPEQVLGDAIDFAADQFAFCVCLYEATYGARPFKGRDIAELFGAMAQRLAKAQAPTDAPRWLRRVIERGLDPKPTKRYPSMDALLAAIDRGPGFGRGVMLFFVVVALVTIGTWLVLRA